MGFTSKEIKIGETNKTNYWALNAAQECDCDFITSGNTVVDGTIIQWYEQTHLKEPIEKKGFDGNFWVWGYRDYTRDYMVCADVARGDGKDFSAFHVIDVESMEQVRV